MFEAEHSSFTSSPPEAVWARWIDPARWSEWDPRIEAVEAPDELEQGSEMRVKLRKGGTTGQRVAALEPGQRLLTEYSLPGARVGHDRVVESRGQGSRVTHRLYVDGPLAGFWALMLGRKQMRETVTKFTG